MKLYIFSVITLIIMFSYCSVAQTNDDVAKPYIDKLDKGQIEEVKAILPELISKYQNNAGILYLQGRLATDGIEAVKYYQMVVENFPQSEWADDALFRIYQYYYALGLYKTAELKIQHLRKEYPNSPYVSVKMDTKLPAQDEKDVKVPTREDRLIVSSPQVEVKALEKDTTFTKSTGEYTLQTGAFSTLINAEKLRDFFENLNYKVEITSKVRSGKSMYLVWIGDFKTLDEARKVAKEIKSKHKIDALVIEKY